MDQLAKAYPNDVRLVFKHFVVHPQIATIPALATCAAQQQGKFWEFEHAVWDLGWGPDPQKPARDFSKFNEDGMIKLATELELNVDKFKTDMKGKACNDQLQSAMQQLSQVGTDGTPTFYVNGHIVSGALPFESFKTIVDQEIKKADDILKTGQVKQEEFYDKIVVEKGKKSLGT